ncbi:MAG: hypothetical protein NXY57DRAFT_988427 [Lentinula lateritia]|nr:MAG: hypothetical protein NXY57DRAFT_988427 [Lentinula lateritia]
MPPNTVTAVWADSSTSKSFEFKSEKMLEFSARAHLNKLVSPLPAGQCETLPSGSLENVETAAVLFHPFGTTLMDELLKKYTAVTEVRFAKVEGDLEKGKSEKERLLAKVTGMEGREKSLLAKVTGMEGREKSLLAKVTSMEGREKSLLAKVTGMEGREKSLLAKITGVEGREEYLQKEIQSLKEEQRQQRVRTSSLEDEITRLSGDFDDWITIGVSHIPVLQLCLFILL